MKIVGIIPARYASSRFPGKPLINLKGKSMIQRVYEGVKRSNEIAEVIVATDDQRIVDEVHRFGGDVMMTSLSHKTGTDRCGEVAMHLDADVVVNIQGDEPLIDFRQLDVLCSAFHTESVQIATLGIGSTTQEDLLNPNRIKLVCDHAGNAMYFSRSMIPNTHHASETAKNNFPFMRHIGVYAYRKSTLLELANLKPSPLEQVESLEQLRWLFHGYTIRVVTTEIETPNIDTPEDVDQVLKNL